MTFQLQPVKLHDCRQHGSGSGAELFIVEGDSASRSVARARDLQRQAVLPMQGKPLNGVKANRRSVARNELYQKLIGAIGAGWDDDFDVESVRYDRVILLFDPDADGIHCGALMSMFFFRWMRELLESGRIAVVRPPMYSISAPHYKDTIHAYSEDHYRKIRLALDEQGIDGAKGIRYRGLASIDESVLRSTCIDAATRTTYTLTVDDALAAIKTFGAAGK